MMTKDAVYPWTKNHEWNDEWVTKSVRRFPEWGKTFDRNNLMINQVRLLFGEVPSKLDDFIFASQSVQAEAMKYFIEMWPVGNNMLSGCHPHRNLNHTL